jgi:Rrf2 family protein
MKISKKGLYALEAMTVLAHKYPKWPKSNGEIAVLGGIPPKVINGVLLDLQKAGLVESLPGAGRGYLLKREPSTVFLGEIIRTIDGPLAPFGNAARLQKLVKSDKKHSALYQVLLDVRNATARIIDHVSVADLARWSGNGHGANKEGRNAGAVTGS